jgi:hypothetical protein
MALAELLDKFIREHGSASIKTEHIELLREQLRDEEKRHAREIADLKSEHAKEVTRLNETHAIEMKYLERKIEELQKPQEPSVPKISDGETAMIKLLVASGGEAILEEMARPLNMQPVESQYTYEKLAGLGLVDLNSMLMGRGQLVGLTPAGNTYAVENGLTKNLPRPAQPIHRGPFRA